MRCCAAHYQKNKQSDSWFHFWLALCEFHGVGAHGLAFYTFEQILIFWMHCREALGRILARGHSRVPVYSGSPRNIVGLLLVRQPF